MLFGDFGSPVRALVAESVEELVEVGGVEVLADIVMVTGEVFGKGVEVGSGSGSGSGGVYWG